MKKEIYKVGMGFDAHRFEPATQPDNVIMLCGIEVLCEYRIIAHSDGDVALHALTDALLGTISAGDIGMHFPPTDMRWKNAGSAQFVQHACQLIANKGGKVNNVDLTIICQTPYISSYRLQMQHSLSTILSIEPENINIKATTTEGMGFTGRKEGIAAQAIASITIST